MDESKNGVFGLATLSYVYRDTFDIIKIPFHAKSI
jgi:hypothetical protein